MRTRLVSLVLAITLVPALLAAPAIAQPKEVVIGLIYPLSGPTASAGIDEKHVYELFADMVNGKEPMIPGAFYQQLRGLPGIPGGARLRLIFVDHQGKPDIGQAEAERLITQEKVHALVGAWQSGVTATTSQVAERFGIPHFNAESSSPMLTRRGFKWFFRSSPHDEHFTQAMFDFLGDFQKKRSVRSRRSRSPTRTRSSGRTRPRRNAPSPRRRATRSSPTSPIGRTARP
jgi:branched-chain amino acid transport system substrate-binding protein